jgi:teichoic acid transport system permease protein
MYSVPVFSRGHSGLVLTLLTHNPAYVYLTLARHALLTQNPAPPVLWLEAAAWAVGIFVLGYLYFWRGEEQYGNV